MEKKSVKITLYLISPYFLQNIDKKRSFFSRKFYNKFDFQRLLMFWHLRICDTWIVLRKNFTWKVSPSFRTQKNAVNLIFLCTLIEFVSKIVSTYSKNIFMYIYMTAFDLLLLLLNWSTGISILLHLRNYVNTSFILYKYITFNKA